MSDFFENDNASSNPNVELRNFRRDKQLDDKINFLKVGQTINRSRIGNFFFFAFGETFPKIIAATSGNDYFL